MTSPLLGLPELVIAQDVPETTVNEIAFKAEAFASSTSVEDRDIVTPPGSPVDGDRYILGASPTGAWSGQGGKIALYVDGWHFFTPLEGMLAWVRDEDVLYIYDGSAWGAFAGGAGVDIEDEGVSEATGVTTLNFVGAGVSATDMGGGVVDVTISGGGYSGGVQSVPILAAAMLPRTTSGAATGSSETTTNKVMLSTLDFDQSTDEFAQFMFPMPKSWNESTVTAQFLWTATTTGNVVWGIQGVAITDDDPVDAAFGTAQTVTDAVTAANDLMQSAFTSAMTIGGTPAEGDLVCFQVYRDADNGSDTLAADAKLVGIRLNITTNAADDS